MNSPKSSLYKQAYRQRVHDKQKELRNASNKVIIKTDKPIVYDEEKRFEHSPGTVISTNNLGPVIDVS